MSTILIVAVRGIVHVMKALGQNYASLASEAIILITIDLLLFPTDPRIDPSDRTYIGLVMVMVDLGYLLYSQGTLLYASGNKALYSIKKKCRSKRQQANKMRHKQKYK